MTQCSGNSPALAQRQTNMDVSVQGPQKTGKSGTKQLPGTGPSVDQLSRDPITALAESFWAPYTAGSHQPFDPKIVMEIYSNEILQSSFSVRRIMVLEISQYLECFLIPNYKPALYPDVCRSSSYVLSICAMINEKCRERIPPWAAFIDENFDFKFFFQSVMELATRPLTQYLSEAQSRASKTAFAEAACLMVFLNSAYNSIEVPLIRTAVQGTLSIAAWISVTECRRQAELKSSPRWNKFYSVALKRTLSQPPEEQERLLVERRFLRRLIDVFLDVLIALPHKAPRDPPRPCPVPVERGNAGQTYRGGAQLPPISSETNVKGISRDFPNGGINSQSNSRLCSLEVMQYLERFLEMLVGLLCLLPTRRFFHLILDDSHMLAHCNLSTLRDRPEGKLFGQLLDLVRYFFNFEINNETGTPLTRLEMTAIHYDRISSLQRIAFQTFPDLKEFSLSNVAGVDTAESLRKLFSPMPVENLQKLVHLLHLVPTREEMPFPKELLMEILVTRHAKSLSQLNLLNRMALYPTEKMIWDEDLVPVEYYAGEKSLALHKLNLQFLTLHDYLVRNFELFRLETTYDIRQDIEDTMLRMKPWQREDGEVHFGGWARMALPIQNFTIVEVTKPDIGHVEPARVRADVTLLLDVPDMIRAEWEGLRKKDACFLLTVRPTRPIGSVITWRESIPEQVGLTYVRGCEIEGMLDESGRVIDEAPDRKPTLEGKKRTFRVWLDCHQYRQDMEAASKGEEDVYETFNILLRRKPKENNFKAVLETIRELLNTEFVIPEWLHDILLGYGDPDSAHYSKLPTSIAELNWNDTFLSMDHIQASFPDYDVSLEDAEDKRELQPPYRLHFMDLELKNTGMKQDPSLKKIIVSPHIQPAMSPFPRNKFKGNQIPFTPTQVEAIKSGMQPGLTMVVGPPGSGKTDVAVQIISNLYHNFPNQRTLIVTHSNQALNQLFEKIMVLDIDERHLLRLGHGEEALETEKDFSRYGRVNYVLAKRYALLEEVKQLAESLNISGDVSSSCENASLFYKHHIESRWSKFLLDIQRKRKLTVDPKPDIVFENFPFSEFFKRAPPPLFRAQNFNEDMEAAQTCFRYIKHIFDQLEEFQAFELLRTGLDRVRYLLIKEAKIIAMTCTHAALKRQEIVSLGFTFDNILMEEAAQILEIETFIPLLCQKPREGHNRLKRWIMIGDHNQLPPVIKNVAFQKYSNMEQSLFARFVKLGVPYILLDAQGRARPTICDLYNWRYERLSNLPHTYTQKEYRMANGGFAFDYQLINVEDYQGVGEQQPTPHFFQNLAEAEYIAAVYTYMRLQGYPAEKISVLTTYNGQKMLLRDVFQRRCAHNQMIGMPHKITTVDKFQGQQNDYILLSLVRTLRVGHLRDVRRLVVAMSRARLGLYIFARVRLFHNCYELRPAFDILMRRPLDLHLVPSERHPCFRWLVDEEGHLLPPPSEVLIMKEMPDMADFVYHRYQEQVKVCGSRPKPLALDQSSKETASLLFVLLSRDGSASILPMAHQEVPICYRSDKQLEDGVVIPVDLTQPNPNGVEFDNLYLDMNGIIHPCTHPEDKPPPKNMDEMMENIFAYIDRLVRVVRPRRLLYMAIDGVAPRAKMNQQRSRRFRASKEAAEKTAEIERLRKELSSMGASLPPPKESHFDSNCITPGTPFMAYLAKSLDYYIQLRMQSEPCWQNMLVILSDSNVPGEGEHKIMDFIRRQRASPDHDPNTHHVLCGADADLIMLGLATHEPNFTIIREEFIPNKPSSCDICGQSGHTMQECKGLEKARHESIGNPPPGPSEPEFILVRLSVLREYLARELNMPHLDFVFNIERAIDDWVFMCFFVGNDFLPHLPSLEIREGAIDRLVGLYKKALDSTGGYVTNSGLVNLSRVQVILSRLGREEDEIFRQRQQRELEFRRRDMEKKKREAMRNARDNPQYHMGGQFTPQSLRGGRGGGIMSPREEIRSHRINAMNHQMTYEQNANNAAAAMLIKEQLTPGVREREPVDNAQPKEPEEPVDEVRLYEEGFKERYYLSKFSTNPSELVDGVPFSTDVAQAYAYGLCWVLRYYYQGCAAWNWYFPYHYAPFASDFVGLAEMGTEFPKGTSPFDPLEQLMGVFPAASKAHVPEPWRHLMYNPNSPIIDFYPSDFKVDLNGKKFAWQGVALLPFTQEDRLRAALKPLYHLLTPEEVERNRLGTDRVYASVKHEGIELLKRASTSDEPVDLSDATTSFHGMAGALSRLARQAPIGETVESPIRARAPIENIQVYGLTFHNPTFPEGYVFSAKRLPGALDPPPVLKKKELSEAENRGYRPVIGFNRRADEARLSQAGHRMIMHNMGSNARDSVGGYGGVPYVTPDNRGGYRGHSPGNLRMQSQSPSRPWTPTGQRGGYGGCVFSLSCLLHRQERKSANSVSSFFAPSDKFLYELVVQFIPSLIQETVMDVF
ncbi:unnamed protein product [Cyprideis torosa]|uniref:5'-3' exoribonuclease 2 homolog n=1 Tax=Cyprideis torosa TaxID=163714 RepID=A0A7R8W167_9CRUS|nr:unnamed protein product [Cyprideis torosa]CAG0879509.1 unnamed protein product [Cyprideis torosa]